MTFRLPFARHFSRPTAKTSVAEQPGGADAPALQAPPLARQNPGQAKTSSLTQRARFLSSMARNALHLGNGRHAAGATMASAPLVFVAGPEYTAVDHPLSGKTAKATADHTLSVKTTKATADRPLSVKTAEATAAPPIPRRHPARLAKPKAGILKRPPLASPSMPATSHDSRTDTESALRTAVLEQLAELERQGLHAKALKVLEQFLDMTGPLRQAYDLSPELTAHFKGKLQEYEAIEAGSEIGAHGAGLAGTDAHAHRQALIQNPKILTFAIGLRQQGRHRQALDWVSTLLEQMALHPNHQIPLQVVTRLEQLQRDCQSVLTAG
ncbi:MAG: hypothetical protein ACRYGK_11750 [Janthinobacterium lividum]